MSFVRAFVAELRNDPDALAELRALVADITPAGHLLQPDEAAERLGVSRRTVNRMATEGRIPAVKVGRGWRFPADQLIVAPRRRPPIPATLAARRPSRPHSATTDDAAVAAIRG